MILTGLASIWTSVTHDQAHKPNVPRGRFSKIRLSWRVNRHSKVWWQTNWSLRSLQSRRSRKRRLFQLLLKRKELQREILLLCALALLGALQLRVAREATFLRLHRARLQAVSLKLSYCHTKMWIDWPLKLRNLCRWCRAKKRCLKTQLLGTKRIDQFVHKNSILSRKTLRQQSVSLNNVLQTAKSSISRFRTITSTTDMLLVMLRIIWTTKLLWQKLKMKPLSNKLTKFVSLSALMETIQNSYMLKRQINLQPGSESHPSKMIRSSISSKCNTHRYRTST